MRLPADQQGARFRNQISWGLLPEISLIKVASGDRWTDIPAPMRLVAETWHKW
jgi:hypothetical protein